MIQLGKLKSINIYFTGLISSPGVHLIHPFSDVFYLFSDKFFSPKNAEILNLFESLSYALDIQHGLSLDDRRFYYDEITGHYHPIYYDGESYLFKNIDKHDFSKVTKYSKRNINEIRKN